MVHWSNWSGRHQAEPSRLHFVRSEDDAAALATGARERGRTIRVAGGGHSHAPLVPNSEIIADISALSGVISADPDTQRAWVRAGTPIYALGPGLHQHGMALLNQGDIDRQTIGGACATGTHGTGRGAANLSAAVVGARFATSAGEIEECGLTSNPMLCNAARLNLGSIGIITALELQLRGSYRLAESAFVTTGAEAEARIAELMEENDRFEFYWSPQTDHAFVKRMNETEDPAVYPVASEGKRVGWSFEVYPSHRAQLHTEMEYSVAAADGPACFSAIKELITSDFPDVEMPVEYRAIAPDDVWLSTANGRETVSISVHRDIEHDERPLFRACEEIFLDHGGRPHWGKVNFLDREQLAGMHSDWDRWWQTRDEIDPDGTFLNDYMRSIRPD
jgi:FAD/FMN-containing dehydrogenase